MWGNFSRTSEWTYNPVTLQRQGVSVSVDTSRHKLSVRLDAGNTIGERSEENEWSVYIYINEAFPNGCPGGEGGFIDCYLYLNVFIRVVLCAHRTQVHCAEVFRCVFKVETVEAGKLLRTSPETKI